MKTSSNTKDKLPLTREDMILLNKNHQSTNNITRRFEHMITYLKSLFKRTPKKSLWLQYACKEPEGRIMEVERRRG